MGTDNERVGRVMQATWRQVYRWSVIILALVSIILVVLQLAGAVNLDRGPWMWVDDAILAFFTVDYGVRFWRARDKRAFFWHNFFDLLAIIPFNALFSFFRLARLTRLFRLAQVFRLVRLIGFIGKLRGQLRTFFETNGFGYLVVTSLSILILAASLYAYAENVSWGEALWWAITTTTTVGYGDVAPQTAVGKWAATILMLVGIGFIGALTSTITAYFSQRRTTSKNDQLAHQLDRIEQQNRELRQAITDLQRQLTQKK